MARLMLPALDRVEILTVLDLSLDLLMAGSDTVRRVDVAGTSAKAVAGSEPSTGSRAWSRSCRETGRRRFSSIPGWRIGVSKGLDASTEPARQEGMVFSGGGSKRAELAGWW
jgi:hypothetical protein